MPGSDDSPPYDALLFITHGNYGSTLYDPDNDREYLLVSICDDCVRDAGNRGIVLRCESFPRPKTDRDVWNPDG